jgi:cysteinyl-tRNA synthetase
MILFNSMGKKPEEFKSREPGKVKIFTCGPSVYQRAHIGNYRTFLYEDTVVRYLEYKGYEVRRAMNFTDIEDKAVSEAVKTNRNVFEQTEPAKNQFFKDLELLNIKKPLMAMASTSVDEAIKIIGILLDKGYAYNYKGDIFFDPLKFKDFGKLYGLDKSRWPKKRIRYKLDTYPGMRWNLGDFILWHKANTESSEAEAVWESPWGPGRPSWNVEDPAMIMQTLGDQVDINCGGIDNIIRHHDYNIAVMESAFGKTYANYYMHGAHLYVDGKKMSKSLGNIYYPGDLVAKGYSGEEVRFFLTAVKHYRKKLNFTDKAFDEAVQKLRLLRSLIAATLRTESAGKTGLAGRLRGAFEKAMDNDLAVAAAVDALIKELKAGPASHTEERREIKEVLEKIDGVLQFALAAADKK